MPQTTISAYLIRQLQELGARHPLSYYKTLEKSYLPVINTYDE